MATSAQMSPSIERKPKGRILMTNFGGFIGTLLKATKVAEFGVAIMKTVKRKITSDNAVDSHQDESVDDYMDLVLKNDFTEGFVTTCWKVVSRLEDLNATYRNLPPTEKQVESEIDRQLEMLEKAGAFKLKRIDEDHFCQAVDNLMKSVSGFQKTSLFDEVQMLRTTSNQLEKRCISISFFGAQNCGKSTLLNALLGDRFLPVKDVTETSLKVSIQHDRKYHTVATETELCEQCPYLCEKQNGKVVNETKGAVAIRRRLRQLNKEVRQKKLDELPECTIFAYIPALSLSSIPDGWSICLADNAGFGEANEHIMELANTSVHDSSAYVYVTNSFNIGSDRDSKFFKQLAEHHKESLSNNRLLIAITKTDMSYSAPSQGDDSEDEVASVDSLKSRVFESVMKAAEVKFSEDEVIKFSEDEVIPVSGKWGGYANYLRCFPNDEETKEDAARELSRWSLNQPCGQGESGKGSLLKLSTEDIANRLEEASGIRVLEQRIQKMTCGGVGIWADKVKGDYCQYLEVTTGELEERRIQTSKLIQLLQEHIDEQLKLYDEVLHEFDSLMSVCYGKDSPVYKAIEKAYEKDSQDSDPKGKGQKLLQDLSEKFEKKCQEKIAERQNFGPEELQQDLKQFLKYATSELERTVNDAFKFPAIHKVVKEESEKMTERVSLLRYKALGLCEKKKGTLVPVSNEEGATTEEGMQLEPPNLGDLKERVNIPPVTLSVWERFTNWLRKTFSKRGADQEPDTECTEYRTWSSELKQTMKSLLEDMKKECDDYISNIKLQILEYFFADCTANAKMRLEAYRAESTERLRREFNRQKMEAIVHKHMQIMEAEMGKLCEHLPELRKTLEEQAKEYKSRAKGSLVPTSN